MSRTSDVVCLVIEALIFAFCCYILIALIVFLTNRSKVTGRQRSSSSGTSEAETTRKIFIGFYAAYVVTVAAKSILCFAYFGVLHVLKKEHCIAVAQTHQFIHTTAELILFIYLWFRQNVLYQNRYFNRLATPAVQWFSRVLLAAILGIGLASISGIFYTVGDQKFERENMTCILVAGFTNNDVIIFCGYAIIIILHGSILFLFVNILHKQQRVFNTSRRKTSDGTGWTALGQLRRLIRYYVIATAVATVTDIIVTITDTALRGHVDTMVSNLFWDVDMVVNLFCVLICFTNGKQMLLPWKRGNMLSNPKRAAIESRTVALKLKPDEQTNTDVS